MYVHIYVYTCTCCVSVSVRFVDFFNEHFTVVVIVGMIVLVVLTIILAVFIIYLTHLIIVFKLHKRSDHTIICMFQLCIPDERSRVRDAILD